MSESHFVVAVIALAMGVLLGLAIGYRFGQWRGYRDGFEKAAECYLAAVAGPLLAQVTPAVAEQAVRNAYLNGGVGYGEPASLVSEPTCTGGRTEEREGALPMKHWPAPEQEVEKAALIAEWKHWPKVPLLLALAAPGWAQDQVGDITEKVTRDGRAWQSSRADCRLAGRWACGTAPTRAEAQGTGRGKGAAAVQSTAAGTTTDGLSVAMPDTEGPPSRDEASPGLFSPTRAESPRDNLKGGVPVPAPETPEVDRVGSATQANVTGAASSVPAPATNRQGILVTSQDHEAECCPLPHYCGAEPAVMNHKRPCVDPCAGAGGLQIVYTHPVLTFPTPIRDSIAQVSTCPPGQEMMRLPAGGFACNVITVQPLASSQELELARQLAEVRGDLERHEWADSAARSCMIRALAWHGGDLFTTGLAWSRVPGAKEANPFGMNSDARTGIKFGALALAGIDCAVNAKRDAMDGGHRLRVTKWILRGTIGAFVANNTCAIIRGKGCIEFGGK